MFTKKITPSFRHRWEDKDVERHWDDVSGIYIKENDKVKKAHTQRFVESIKHLKLFPGAKILNISSRDGEANDFITQSEPQADTFNLEISAKLIQVASQIRPNIRQQKIETYSEIPFKDHFFDAILTLETLEHVAQPLEFLSEMHRVSKPNTTMVLSCPPSSAEWPYRVYTFLFGGHGEGPHRFPHPSEVKQMLTLTGWKLKKHFGTVLIPVGPKKFQEWGEQIIEKTNYSWVSNLGIRQFYICERN